MNISHLKTKLQGHNWYIILARTRLWTLEILRLVKFYTIYGLRFLYPINDNKFMYISSEGKYYGCNPKYIYKKALNVPNSRHVWVFKKGFVPKETTEIQKYVILYSWGFYFHAITSKYFVNNFYFNRILPRKIKGQVNVETWHGTALKTIGLDNPESKDKDHDTLKESSVSLYRKEQSFWDIFMSGSSYMTNIYSHCFYCDGILHEIGTPRNDIFFERHPDIYCKVKDHLGIKVDSKILLYAPTFRDKDSLSKYSINLQKVKSELESITKSTWVVLIRLHYFLLNGNNIQRVNELFPQAINASDYPDMQELLYATDALITDYSSSMFDFMYSFKPCFIYAEDIQTYERGFYFDIHKMPFPIAENNDEMIANIRNFNNDNYISHLLSFLSEIGSIEHGDAAHKVLQLMLEAGNKIKKRPIISL